MQQSILPDLAVAAAAAAAAHHEFLSAGGTPTATSAINQAAANENSLLRGLGGGPGGVGVRQPSGPHPFPPPHLSSILHANSQTHRELIQHQLQLHHHHQQQLQGKLDCTYIHLSLFNK